MALALAVCFGWILGTCVHEFCHAMVAYAGGDKSVKEKGYLTLNPLKYTDPGLTLVVPIVMLLLGGIALPGAAVYINRRALRNRLWHSAVSVAGPVGTAIMVLVFAAPFMLAQVPQNTDDWLWLALALLVLLEIVAFILNALPFPPLDGYGVIEPWLPGPIRQLMNRFGQYGIWIIFGLLWFVRPLNVLLWGSAELIALALGVPPEMHQRAYHLFSEQKYYVAMLLVVIMLVSRRGKNKTQTVPTTASAAPNSDQAAAPVTETNDSDAPNTGG